MSQRSRITLKKGSLWEEVIRKSESALASGSLLPIPTEYTFIEDAGVRFFVRILRSLALKDEERNKQEKDRPENPFLPYEEELFVAAVSDTHVALLNKFNVVEHHLLIVTRTFEDQETLLKLEDFEALWACLAEYDGLGFYNGGEAAGASQKHKHLQFVPLPLAPEGPSVPLEVLFQKAVFGKDFGTVPDLPFQNAFCLFDENVAGSPGDAAARTVRLYRSMLSSFGIAPDVEEGIELQSGPYCLLITRRWMLIVPRSREFFGNVSINSLGYAGALLVRNREQLENIRAAGPMAVLRAVSIPMPKVSREF